MPAFDLEQRCRSFVLFDNHCQHRDHKYAATNTVIAPADNADNPWVRAGVTELYGVTEQFHVGLVLPGLSSPPVLHFVLFTVRRKDLSNVGQRRTMLASLAE